MDADEAALAFEPWNGMLPATTGDEELVWDSLGLCDMMRLLESHGDRFTGNNVEDIAQDWLDNDFTAATTDEWCEIGVWDAHTAAQLRDMHLTPAQVADRAETLIEEAGDDAAEEYTDGDPIYSACNGDTSVIVFELAH